MSRWDSVLQDDQQKLALEAALETGALRRCPYHADVILSQEDTEPQPSIDAYDFLVRRAQAQGLVDYDPQTDLIFVIQWADETCPVCGV